VAPSSTILAIAHSTARGTRKAIQDAIFEAGASADATAHQDFDDLGMAYDLTALDRPLDETQLARLVEAAQRLTGDARAIRSIRQVQG
jgi:D-3-phosphoglycerate dehydrogenase